jgi:multiple sugar transport system permease protein
MRSRLSSGSVRYIIALIMVFWAIFPIYWIVATSLKATNEAISIPPIWVPNPPHIENYLNPVPIQEPYRGWTGLIDSGICAMGAAILALVIGMFAGYGFSKLNIRGTNSWLNWILSIRMLPLVAVIIPIHTIFRTIGLIDKYPGIWIAHLYFNLPFCVLMLKSFFDTVPTDLLESAKTEGYSNVEIFWKIALPLIKGGVATTFLFAFIFSWNDFLFQWLLTKHDVRAVMIVIPNIIKSPGTEYWNVMAAVGVLSFIPVITLAIILQRYLVRGLTLGVIRR